MDQDENILYSLCCILLFPLSPRSCTQDCIYSLRIAAMMVFAVKQQGWKIWDPQTGCQAVCLFSGVIGNVQIAAEGLPCAEICRHQRATQILQAISFRKARVWGEHVEVLSSYPVNRDYPGVSFSPIFTRMEILQCKESKAVSLHANWEDIYVCANTARAFRMIWS